MTTIPVQPAEPICPICKRRPVFVFDRRVREWGGECKPCGIVGPVAFTEMDAIKNWMHRYQETVTTQLVPLSVNEPIGFISTEHLADLENPEWCEKREVHANLWSTNNPPSRAVIPVYVAQPAELSPKPNKLDRQPIDANELERIAKNRPDDCFLTGSGVLKLIGGIRQLEQELRSLKEAIAQPDPVAQAEPLKDGEIAKVVNDLRDVALKFHNTQQLRERISQIVVPLLQSKGGAA